MIRINRLEFNQITLLQYILIVNGVQVGIGILTLPRDVASEAGTSGWISILLGWGISIVSSFVIISIMKKHPMDTIFEILIRYFGKWIGKAIALIWVIYFSTGLFIILTTTIQILLVWVLPETVYMLLVLLILIPWVFITRYGIKIISRYCQLVFFITLWMPLILLIPLKDASWLNLLPIFQDNWSGIFDGVKSTIFSFLGFEITFILYPFLKNKERAYLGVFIANTITCIVLLQVSLTSFLIFSIDDLSQLIWPTLSLLKPISFPFLERMEIIFLSVYMFQISTTAIPFLFFSIFGAANILGKKDHRIILYIFAVLLTFVAIFFSPAYQEVVSLGEKWASLGFWLVYVFPPLVMVFMYVRRGWIR